VLQNVRKRRYGARRRRELIGPGSCVSIDPYGLHAGLRRADHVSQGIVAHVQHFAGWHACRAQQMRKYPRVGLGRTRGRRGDVAVEQLGDTAALEIGVAVAERKQPRGPNIGNTQPLDE